MPRLVPALFLATLLCAFSKESAAEEIDYVADVRPILESRCYACHGPLKQEQGLRVDTAAAMRKGGDSGPGIVPGKSAASLLLERITTTSEDERMPAEGEPLSAVQIDTIRRWIDEGAAASVDQPASDPRDHWAYQPPARPALPQVKNADWAEHPIDAFLAAGHEQHKLSPQPPAAHHVLVRRLYLDLIGLPPTPEQLRAALDDQTLPAWQSLVDQLLGSPLYGERWGRHWMDVWRYSDWAGYKDQIRDSQRHIWRWRDWIIESLNADKGYDRMVLEMLAADEIAPTDRDALRATGFLARNWYKFNRNVWLDNVVEHSSKAFLGTTFNCARCHDHKYDPISQRSYYRLRAFFEPHEIRTDAIAGQPDLQKDGLPRAYDAKAETPTFLFTRGNEKHPDKAHPLTAGLPEIFGAGLKINAIELPVEAYYPALGEDMRKAQIAAARAAFNQAEQDLEKLRQGGDEIERQLATQRLAVARAQLDAVQARIAAELAKYATTPGGDIESLAKVAAAAQREVALRAAEVARTVADQKLAKARSADKPNDKKAKDAVARAEKESAAAAKKLAEAKAAREKPGSKYEPLGPQYPKTSTGRRAALARWIVDRGNPLAARVAVNHIWLRHFGQPLVDNMFDFGLRSRAPRHGALLDWLAVEFMENGWSMKHLHRLIVTSRAYRMTSSTSGASAYNVETDPDNHFLWRMNSRRLEAEAVRDSILSVAGNLDLNRGGPDIDYKRGLTERRRSVYFRHAYEKQMKFLELFDAASVNECYRRSESIIPQQALALANSTLALEQSRLLARRLARETSSAAAPDEAFIERAYEHVLSRPPSPQETDACRVFVDEQAKLLADKQKLTPFAGGQAAQVKPSDDPRMRARENLVHVLMNHNDFVTIR